MKPLTHRIRHLAKMKALTKQRDELRAQLQALSSTHSTLKTQVLLLEAACRCLATLQDSLPPREQHTQIDEANSCCLDELQQLHADLLQLLDDGASGHTATATALSEDLQVQRIAPRRDPLSFFCSLASQLQQAGLDIPSEPSVLQLSALHQQAVLAGSMQLHARRAGLISAAAAAQKLAQGWNRYYVCALSTIMHGCADVTARLVTHNCAAGQPDAEGAQAACARYASIVSQLELTPLQLHDIAAGISLFGGLIAQITRQQQEAQRGLQQQQQSQQEEEGSGSNDSSSSEVRGYDSIRSLRAAAEVQQRGTARVQLLLQKEYLLKAVTCAWFYGCLSWEQLTLAAVLCWPYIPLVGPLAQAVAAAAQQQQQQQQQEEEEDQQP